VCVCGGGVHQTPTPIISREPTCMILLMPQTLKFLVFTLASFAIYIINNLILEYDQNLHTLQLFNCHHLCPTHHQKSQINPSIPTKHPCKPTRGQSHNTYNPMRSSKCRVHVYLLYIVTCCWQPHQLTRYGPKKSSTVRQEWPFTPEQRQWD